MSVSQLEIPAAAVSAPHAATAPEVAKVAGLRYVTDVAPGIVRKRVGSSFVYTAGQRRLRDQATLERIRSLAVPPAWTDVWICPHASGHIQATGRDARGRKQYRYHARWREVRDETKYHRMLPFGEALPKVRAAVEADLSLPSLPRRKVLATVVRLLEHTLIRIGNEEYVRANNSFGLTTMRNKHVQIVGSTLRFTFTGKSGKAHDVGVRDRRLARILKQCQDLPGYDLFQYIDETGERQGVDSADVNAYLNEISGEDFTAKDFRTWAGTLLAALELQQLKHSSDAEAKRNVVQAMSAVAARLGNTAAICRACYVHPAVVERYLDGSLGRRMRRRVRAAAASSALAPEEAAVLRMLRAELCQSAACSAGRNKPRHAGDRATR